MSKLRVTFTFVGVLVQEPVIWRLSQKFAVKTNIRRADVKDGLGWVTLELEGEEIVLQQGIEWVRSTGTEVELVTGDVIE
ncbi:MAG: FeS-binding protein [SAR202 cluster bacterium]|jgi:ABC-type methionine transport system ATPase subunit|nr:FeS-binding protein [SAR202 cluster bacterium]|tara:strand:+ start:1135 stop:1374 length:240 start_codon:yes stop_codon:yes gene_type:complete